VTCVFSGNDERENSGYAGREAIEATASVTFLTLVQIASL